MTDRFTPGPWRVDITRREYSTAVLFDTRVTGGVRIRCVAEVIHPAAPRNTLGAQEREANAQLIAAAPDLLEACRRLLGWAFWDQGGSAGRDAEFARAVIAKATGEKEQEARDVT